MDVKDLENDILWKINNTCFNENNSLKVLSLEIFNFHFYVIIRWKFINTDFKLTCQTLFLRDLCPQLAVYSTVINKNMTSVKLAPKPKKKKYPIFFLLDSFGNCLVIGKQFLTFKKNFFIDKNWFRKRIYKKKFGYF